MAVFQFTPYVAFYGLVSVTLALVMLYVLQRRKAPGGLYFSLIMASGLAYSVCNTLEMAAVDVWLKILFAKLTYIGVVSIAPTWLLFNMVYRQRSRRIRSRYAPLIWVVPAITIALVFTNEWHHLVWASITPSSAVPGSVLIYSHGPAIWAFMLYSYTLMLAGTLLLVRTSMGTYKRFRQQTILLLLGALIAWSGNIIYFANTYFLKIDLIAGLDLTPFTICVVGLLYAWSMFRYRLFDLIPVARETVISNMTDGVAVLDNRDRLIDANQAARRLLGRDTPLGKPASQALAAWPELLACYRNLGERPIEVPLQEASGTRWFDVQASPLRDNAGAQTGCIVTMVEITRRKADEEALDESRRNLRTLFDTLDDLIFIAGEDGRILEINQTAVRRLGYSREELLSADSPFSRAQAGPSRLVTKAGDVIEVETHVAPGLWGGRPAVFGISRDVTEFLKAQEALERLNGSLLDEIEERKLTEARLESSLSGKEALLSEVHHRVKNNMQIISRLLDRPGADVRWGEGDEAFLEIQNRIMSIALVHEKLHETHDLYRLDFAGYVESLLANLSDRYGKPGIRITVDVEDLLMDLDLALPCGQIISELASNALKYAYPGGRGEIRVGLRRTGNLLRLTVGDDGVGLPQGLDFRNPDTLGLQLVNTLVDQIEGQITLAAGPGATFEITFAEAWRARNRMEEISAGAARGTSADGPGGRKP